MKLRGLSHLLVEQVAVVFAIVAYLTGIVTVKPHPSAVEDLLSSSQIKPHNGSHHTVDKTVLVVIDALRADHLASTSQPLMPSLQELLTKTKAYGYVLHTAAPTVTLPRIKSLVTGAIPGFMDVVDNFGTGTLTDDNLVQRWVDAGKRIHFYGDDTWIKLFPTQFSKQDGVTSFFVADYTEVDRNVTRHIPSALASDDWDVLILHYLGLDHIGHLEGPMSPLIGPKLLEMDRVVKDIHTKLDERGRGYLVVVCGDHGMSDAGGHGGSSHSEVTTSAMLISNLFDKKKFSKGREVQQVDIAPTLAYLTGIGIPTGNVGKPIAEVFSYMSVEKRMMLHHDAAKQLMAVARGAGIYANQDNAELLFEEATRLHKEVLKELLKDEPDAGKSVSDAERVCRFYQECQDMVSSVLRSKLQSYDLTTIFAATCAVVLALTICMWRLYMYPVESKQITGVAVSWCAGGTFSMWLLCCAAVSTSQICHVWHPTSWLLGAAFVYLLLMTGQTLCAGKLKKYKVSRVDPLYYFLVVGTGFHTISLLGTSMVEEEHQTVYFLSNSFHVAFIIKLIIYLKGKLPNIHLMPREQKKEGLDAGYSNIEDSSELPTSIKSDVKGWKWMLALKKTPAKLIVLLSISLALSRLMRSWNATGDKWKHLEDIGDDIRAAGGSVLVAVVLTGLVLTFFMLSQNCSLLVLLTCGFIFGRHFPYSYSGIFEAQIAHLLIFIIFVYGLLKAKLIDFKTPNSNGKNIEIYEPEEEKISILLKYSFTALTLLCLLLQRADNVGLVSLVLLQSYILSLVLCKLVGCGAVSQTTAALVVNWMAFAHFFYQGNSNSLATVDISAGFVGVSNYRPIIHGFFIATQTFGGSFLTYLTYLMQVITKDGQSHRCHYTLYVWWAVRLATMSLYLVNVAFQRHHLFIWSVFTPKLLYEGAHLLMLCCLTLFMWGVEKICTVLEVSYRFE